MKAMEQVKISLKAGKGLSGMSPAAQRLASGKLGIRLGTDSMLQASYTPSVRHGSSTPGGSTPGTTPRSVRSGKSTPTPSPGAGKKNATPSVKQTSQDIT